MIEAWAEDRCCRSNLGKNQGGQVLAGDAFHQIFQGGDGQASLQVGKKKARMQVIVRIGGRGTTTHVVSSLRTQGNMHVRPPRPNQSCGNGTADVLVKGGRYAYVPATSPLRTVGD